MPLQPPLESAIAWCFLVTLVLRTVVMLRKWYGATFVLSSGGSHESRLFRRIVYDHKTRAACY